MAARDHHTEFRYSKYVSAKFDRHRQFFVTRLRCTDFLPYMTDVEGFDKDARSKIREKAKVSTSAEANEMFLETLRNSNGQGKWLIFIHVLDELGYELLRELLTGEPDIEEIERSESFLEYLTPVIKVKFCSKQLLPYLVRDKYLDEVDKQAIERRSDNVGPISAAELLLTCVQRLRKDVCSGLRTAFRESQMHGVIEEMTRCYEEFLEKEERDEVFALCPSLSRLGLGGSFRKRYSLGSGGLSEEEEASSPPAARCGSPTLCDPKDLTLRDYQRELYSVVERAKKTLILCPAESGKRFVALNAIKEHLSLARNPDGKVVYLVTKSALACKVLRRCQVFLHDIPSVQMGTESPDGPLSKVLSDNGVVIAKAKIFETLLNNKAVKWTDFSMVVLELGIDYYKKRNHVYNEIMMNYHELKRWPQQLQRMPSILVLSTSICEESPLENMFCTAMDTCATFDIHAIAMVRNNIGSLRQYVSMPLVERTIVAERRDQLLIRTIDELFSRVENSMKENFQSLKMPVDEDHREKRRAEVISPPEDKMSVKYSTWLKTNRSSLGYGAMENRCPHAGFFLTCMRLATIYQAALFINTECRGFDALKFMGKRMNQLKKKMVESKQKQPWDLVEDFYAKTRDLRLTCSPNEKETKSTAVKNKLAEIYAANSGGKVAVLVRYPQSILPMMFYMREELPKVKVECVTGHHQDYSVETARLFEAGFDVLITTWPILAFHLGREMRTWDYVIRTDCPGNNVITWTHPGTETESPVDLLTEASIEKVILEIAQQQQDPSGLYHTRLNDLQIASSERELCSRSTGCLRRLYDKMAGDFFCNGCGAFVCNRAHVRNLDDLWLGLDPALIHRLSTVRHPAQIVFSKGYAKLGRFVCKDCGQKWGIIVHVLSHPHLAFAKEGLDYLVDGRYQHYNRSWRCVDIEIELFDYDRDLSRCLPSSFCVEGESIANLQKRLPRPTKE